jgi:hypothetical protein
MTTFKYEIIDIQEWNRSKEVHASFHKTLKEAEKRLAHYEKSELQSLKRTKQKLGNKFRIQTL